MHSRYYGIDLDSLFSVILECLNEMSTRWCRAIDNSTNSLPAKFRAHLQELHARWWTTPGLSVSVVGPVENEIAEMAYMNQRGNQKSAVNGPEDSQRLAFQYSRVTPAVPSQSFTIQPEAGVMTPPMLSSTIIGESGTSEKGRFAFNGDGEATANWMSPSICSTGTGAPDELSNILRSLGNEQFMEMDRVISYDDFNFEGISSHVPGIHPTSSRHDTHIWE